MVASLAALSCARVRCRSRPAQSSPAKRLGLRFATRACPSRRCGVRSRRSACTTCWSTSTSPTWTRPRSSWSVDGLVRDPRGADPRGAARAARGLDTGDDGVRRRRAGPPRATSRVGAVARRGDRLCRVDGNAAARCARGRRAAGRCGGAPLHGRRSRRRPGRGAGVPAQPAGGGGDARGRAAGLRDERAAAAAVSRLPAEAHRSRLVRHGLGEVAAVDHRDRRSRSTAFSRRCSTATAARRTTRAPRSPARSPAR